MNENARANSLLSSLSNRLCNHFIVEANVVLNKSRHEVVAMIIVFLFSQSERLADLLTCRLEILFIHSNSDSYNYNKFI